MKSHSIPGMVATSVIFFAVLSIMASHVRAADVQPVDIEARDGTSLQKLMNLYAGKGATLRISEPTTLTCEVQEHGIEGEISRHALLIPVGVHLDLNKSTLNLDLRQNSHGVRLSNRSSIRNGTIRIVRSENKGSQAAWHSGISVGAPYDDGGTPEKPGYFSKVSHWTIEDITIDQPFPTAAIQLMSEACHGVIRRVQILDSPKALLGIGMDWGCVGKANSADDQIPRMRELWEANQLYTTHPHDILVEDVQVGHLTRNVDGNDAGVRCSACYNIRIRNVHVKSAAAAVAIFGGDCGFEFAPKELRPLAHTGYSVEGVVIEEAFQCGIILNGLADNVFRSGQKYGYQMLLDPTQPGLNHVNVSDCQLTGSRAPGSLGAFITAVSEVQFRNVTLQNFKTGVRIKDWVDDLKFQNCDLSQNDQTRSIAGTQSEPRGVVFE